MIEHGLESFLRPCFLVYIVFLNILEPQVCKDWIGPSFMDFRENKAGLPREFHTRRYSRFHCFRPVFFARGSRRGARVSIERLKTIDRLLLSMPCA